jgi:diacylglycerol O-acyltransferase
LTFLELTVVPFAATYHRRWYNGTNVTEAVPLTDEDRAILELESDTIAGNTCKVIVLGANAPDVDALRELIAARIDAAPALTRRLGGTPELPAWVEDPDFDLGEHVVEAGLPGPLDEDALRDAIAGLFAQHLDRSRPLWRLDLLPLQSGTALVWRIHHAIADGTTTLRLARELLFEEDDAERRSPAAALRKAARDDARRRGHLAAFLEREFARSRESSPFDGEIGRLRRVGFAVAPLRKLHDAAKSLAGATVNDAVLASVAGGLRRWITAHHGHVGEVRLKVPVSLHHEGDDAGNRDSFFTVAVPVAEEDPITRLRAIHEETLTRKAAHDAERIDQITRELRHVSPRLEGLWEKVQRSPRRFALNVSNVPGPRSPVRVLGAPVLSLHTLAEIGEHHALRVSAISYADAICFGLCADPAIVDDLEALATGIEAEAAEILAAAG